MDNRWAGKTVVCIASGPSLTVEDCAIVEIARMPAIAINTSWKIARFAEILYAADFAWWKRNVDEIETQAERWTNNTQAANIYKLNLHRVRKSLNSGLLAIELAIKFGAKVVLLLGYDARTDNGTHWHGDHKTTKNPDAKRCEIWLRQFMLAEFGDATIINCTPKSAINRFPRLGLVEAIESFMP